MQPVRRATIVTHGRPETVAGARARVEELAAQADVELTDAGDVDLVVVLGGDGTMLRALQRFLGSGVPVLGVNFGRVGFLSSIEPSELRHLVAGPNRRGAAQPDNGDGPIRMDGR